jgi:hypothetical protein
VKIQKSQIVGFLASLVLGSSALSAEEAQVLTEVYTTLPQITNFQDQQKVEAFLNQNLEQLNPETISILESLLPSNQSPSLQFNTMQLQRERRPLLRHMVMLD